MSASLCGVGIENSCGYVSSGPHRCRDFSVASGKEKDMKRNPQQFFSATRAMADIAVLASHTRWQTTPKINKAAKHITSLKPTAGLSELEVVDLPADGKTFFGGWVMPRCWDVKSATLKIVSPVIDAQLLADYQQNPWSLMMWSPATPPGGIEAEVVIVTEVLTGNLAVKGKFALVDKLGQVGTDVIEWLAKLGAVGVITDHVITIKGRKEGRYLGEATEYWNYTNPQWDGAPRLPAFGLTPKVGARLRKLIAKNTSLRLHAVVDSRLYDGSIPLVNARLKGKSAAEIVLTAHMDEPGASDNCSGTALAMEVLRALAEYAAARGEPLKRSVRLLSSVESRGIQGYMANRINVRNIIAGLNLDMLGYDQRVGRAPLSIYSACPVTPSCLELLLAELAAEEAARAPGFRWKLSRAVVVNDCHFSSLPHSAPMCLLEQAPDKTYHSSLDLPENMSPAHIKRIGRMICKAVLFLADAEPDEVFAFAEKIYLQARRALLKKNSDPIETLQHAKQLWEELQTYIGEGLPAPHDKDIPQLRREKQFIRGYLYPKAVLQEKIAAWTVNLAVLSAKRKYRRKILSESASPREIKAAQAIIPQKTFDGYLGFENFSVAQRAELKKRLGFSRGWGAPSWLQWALDLSNGKRTLYDVYQSINKERPTRLAALLTAFPFLREHKLIRYRPIVTSADLLKALRAAGIREGDIVMTHSSLSMFGYFAGGADSVIDTLLKAVGRSGTIIVPTHSLNWLGAQPYDPKTSPSLVGAITNRFLRRKEAVRSLHPTHSVAAIGPLAEALVAGHDHTVAPQAREGFWGNFVKHNGKVLLLCKQASNTLLHAGELWAGAPLPSCRAHIWKDGKRVEMTIPGMPWHTDNFKIVHDRMERRGKIRTTRLGESEFYTLLAKDGVETMMEVMREDPLTPTRPNCKCRWCTHIRAQVNPRRSGLTAAVPPGR
jgi:aminoglycoside 3-N-acetyltransferase